MAVSGLTRLVLQDLSGGMFPSLAPELIPADGAFEITNGLLDEENVVYRRGGTTYLSPLASGSVRLFWSGYLKHGEQQTILLSTGGSFRLTSTGEHVTIGAPGPAVLTRPQVFQGILYLPGGNTWDGESAGSARNGEHYAVAGNRLLVAEGSKVAFSNVPKAEGEALTFEANNFHQLPGGVRITGMEGLRTSCVVFTTQGIWIIGGLNHNLTDEAGNVQQTLDRYSADAVLWGTTGIAGWAGGLIVPCKDNIWLMELGVSSEKAAPFRSISGPIQSTYRSYVAQGYQPGAAYVYRGHYFLPLLSGDTHIDTLVCRLDSPKMPWTRLKGFGAKVAAYAYDGTRLLGALTGSSVTLKLAYFEPNSEVAADADGSAHPFSVTTRDIATGNLVPNTVMKARLSYRMRGSLGAKSFRGGAEWGGFFWNEKDWGEEGETFIEEAQPVSLSMGFNATSFAGAEWGEFNWGESAWASTGGSFTVLEGTAPPDPEALTPHVWRVGRKVRYARVNISLSGPASDLSIRALELFIRPTGRTI